MAVAVVVAAETAVDAAVFAAADTAVDVAAVSAITSLQEQL